MATKLFDSTIGGTVEQALAFIGNILESSTEYSMIGKDLEGKILNRASSVVFGMPGEAIRLGAAEYVLSPAQIAGGICSLMTHR